MANADDRIREAVSRRLVEDPDLNASDITVRVGKGVVILSGSVDSRWEKRHAEDLAYSVAGNLEVPWAVALFRAKPG
jgi:osmotically-inducible protein OsmY